MPFLANEEWNALLLSTLAGLSTVLGALIAVCFVVAARKHGLEASGTNNHGSGVFRHYVDEHGQADGVCLQIIKRPDNALLAFLLGMAFGVRAVWLLVHLHALSYSPSQLSDCAGHGALVHC